MKLTRRVITSANEYDRINTMRDRYLDPPEYDEDREIDDIPYTIDIELDTDIVIDAEHDWDYVDNNYTWAESPDGEDWILDEVDDMRCHVLVDDSAGVADKLSELLVGNIPRYEGTYHISGNLTLEYTINNLFVGPDNKIDDDSADIVYYQSASKLRDFYCDKID